MKKIVILLFVFIMISSAFAQMFQTGQTLKYSDQSVRIGFNPMVNLPGGKFDMYFHGGLAITDGIDFNIDYGWRKKTSYFGAGIKWQLIKDGIPTSFNTGGHYGNNFGWDAAINFTIPFGEKVRFYFGPDANIEFTKEAVYVPLWVFGGFEINMSKTFCFILETEYNVTGNASKFWDPANATNTNHMISFGINMYL
jgi:hypothetical protein